tara:strand:+ start:246 stop:368 length:123 start_codon:yes stop_codon:yes gene_type:complete
METIDITELDSSNVNWLGEVRKIKESEANGGIEEEESTTK